ncbi:hypothetical protein LCGC14_2992310, partial [marine sediment metagenome]
MRNYVSKVLLGIDTKNVKTTDDIALEALTDRQIIAFDWDTLLGLVAGTTNIGFARGTATLGEALVVGPIPKAGIVSAILNPYKAAIKQKITLTVTTVPTVGKTGLFKISYHDNLSIIPNQIKQTIIALQADATNTATTTTWAAAIAAESDGEFLKSQEIKRYKQECVECGRQFTDVLLRDEKFIGCPTNNM